jgi:SAM-dependent methyltransferase/uncharacterized protein YbaR (Trm112 family)
VKSTSLRLDRDYTWDQLLGILQCPVCHQALKFQNVDQGLPYAREYGVLSCSCSQYPVVDGVPIFLSGAVGVFEHTQGHVQYQGPSREDLTGLVLARRGLDALLRCIAFPLRIGLIERIRPHHVWRSRPFLQFMAALRRAKLRRWCVADHDTLTAQDWFGAFFRQYSPIEGDIFNYFFYRFAQPRHLATLALTNSLPAQKKPLLDLACGFGHLGHNLAESPATHAVVGVDRNFFQLWTAQYWIAPKNRFVCADADQPFPFADGSFSATLCCDAFHYFRRKEVTLSEIARCAPDQPVLLTRVGNKLVEPNEGFELTPVEYLTLCGGPAWRAFGENELIERYLRREPVDLAASRAPGVVDGEKWVSLVHPGAPPLMATPRDPGPWSHAVGRLCINPIYTVGRMADGTWRLRFKFPSDHYAFENVLMESFHPQQVTLTDQTYRDVKANIRAPEVELLIKKMVVIGLPEHYVRE